ncbi:hypothetical protein B0G73_12768 [Paraburkholderia sp. BL25I1N1]|nr:hypothetical protein B0G73_12768 [Paraburkholderia sp. BL25I1N1]
MIKAANAAVSKVLKRLHYPLDIMLTCVRWYGMRGVLEKLGAIVIPQGFSLGASSGIHRSGQLSGEKADAEARSLGFR